MANQAAALFPPALRQLKELGERLRLARLRRNYSAESVASRAGITRMTLYKIEQGNPGVSFGGYLSVLRVLNLQNDIDGIARDDELGRKLQDLQLPERKAASRKKPAR